MILFCSHCSDLFLQLQFSEMKGALLHQLLMIFVIQSVACYRPRKKQDVYIPTEMKFQHLLPVKVYKLIHYRAQTKFAKVMFLHLSVSHSVHKGGACVADGGHAWQGGMHGRGACVVGGACVAVGGGMHGRGVCMVGVCVHGWGGMCGRGACVVVGWVYVVGGMRGGGMCGWGHAWWGVCMAAGGMHGRGACVAGGVHGGECAWWGVCMAGGHV